MKNRTSAEGRELTCDAREDTDSCEANGSIREQAKIAPQLLLVPQLADPGLPTVHAAAFSQFD